MKHLHPWLKISVLLGFVLLLAACTPSLPRSYVVLVPDLDGNVGSVIVSGDKGNQVLTQAGQVAGIDGREVKAPLESVQLSAVFADAQAAQPVPPQHFLLYFEFGGTRLTAESEKQLNEVLSQLRARGANTAVEVAVIGHTDTVGSAEDNLLLSTQRAKVVADRLRASGLTFVSLTIESFGKRMPLVPTKDGVPEPRNRRVQVTIR